MLRIAVSFLIRLIGQYQRTNYPYSTHYRGDISPHRSRGLQINLPQKMFFCTGCMEIWSWLHLQVVSQDIGTSNLFTTANPVPTKKRSQWLHRCSWKNRVGVVRTFGSYQSATTRTSQLSPLLPLHLFPRFWLGRLLMNCPQYRQSKRALWYFAYFSRPKSWGNRQTICKNLWWGHSFSTKW